MDLNICVDPMFHKNYPQYLTHDQGHIYANMIICKAFPSILPSVHYMHTVCLLFGNT